MCVPSFRSASFEQVSCWHRRMECKKHNIEESLFPCCCRLHYASGAFCILNTRCKTTKQTSSSKNDKSEKIFCVMGGTCVCVNVYFQVDGELQILSGRLAESCD
jgi:hypothetical protein